ncbi:hypothetical protein OF385_13580 [Glutamicibacter sp. JL.03c]|uniref:hypothetical protein n=1 Tax=Glutamicibacter sp. JL.03c TaxID=2984842 RepID=UPI0021F76E6B|nr:hypothetical protein [Glutamicibacter sp. JL.03c]UYQ77035.1 hypothetical protein OF385_13580 [Glutamicibacter sp. JL.03c]
MNETTGAPQEIVWWDRLLIRLPGYSLIAWAACYGFHQHGLPMTAAVLVFFLACVPLLAGWQIFHLWRKHQRMRDWSREQELTQGEPGVPNVPQIQQKLSRIADEKADRPEPEKPRFGAWGIFLVIMSITAVATGLGIFLAKMGAPRILVLAVITLCLGGLAPLQFMGVRNRAYRAIKTMPKKLAEVRELVSKERYAPSSQRSTQATDSTLDAALLIVDQALDLSRGGHYRSAVDCLGLLALLARDSWPASCKSRVVAEKLQQRINGALAQLNVEERKTRDRHQSS